MNTRGNKTIFCWNVCVLPAWQLQHFVYLGKKEIQTDIVSAIHCRLCHLIMRCGKKKTGKNCVFIRFMFFFLFLYTLIVAKSNCLCLFTDHWNSLLDAMLVFNSVVTTTNIRYLIWLVSQNCLEFSESGFALIIWYVEKFRFFLKSPN